MADESWSGAAEVGRGELRQRFVRNILKLLLLANMFLLLATRMWLSFMNQASLELAGAIEWIYYTIEVLYTITHLIVFMKLSSHSAFLHVEMMFGMLGFEMMLRAWVSHPVWFCINVALFDAALLCIQRREFLNFQSNGTPPTDGPLSEVPSDFAGNA